MVTPDGRWIAYVENYNGTLDLRIIPADGGEPRVLVSPEMGVCAAPSWSPDSTKIAYLLGTPGAPNDVWTVDIETGATRQYTQSVPGGGVATRLVVPEKVSYESFDGETIQAYLYQPPDREPGEQFPGLLWIHGGPTAQFLDTFQPQVQYFVRQGYVVLMPNVRGSTGYGRRFEDLNNGDWGHGDLKDVVAGVDYLKMLDAVDSENFGITGTSYGGIMSMAAVAWAPPGTFKASIPCSGYGDFLHMAGEQELRHVKLLEYELGYLPDAADIYRKCSSIFDLAGSTVPCFVLHGRGKYPGSSSGIDFALALEANYKPFWYKAYPGETYYVASRANVREMLGDMSAFFDLYLKGKAHDLPEGRRPLTHLSGVATGQSSGPGAVGGTTTPAPDVAN